MMQSLRSLRLVPIVLVSAICLFTLKMVGIITDGGYTLGAGRMSQADRLHHSREAPEQQQEAVVREKPVRPSLTPNQTAMRNALNSGDVTGSVGAAKAEPKSKPDAQGETKPGEGKPADAKAADAKAADAKAADAKAADAKAADAKAADAKAANAKAAAKPVDPKPGPNGTPVTAEAKPLSTAERAILERLQERRQELEKRSSELDMRETLLQDAQSRLDAKLNELKQTEERIVAATKKKDAEDSARFKGLVTMYENMKAKEAAKIFERLDTRILVEVAGLINPRRMSDILAQMTPDAAERLTVELANRGNNVEKAPAPADLPKIEGRPAGT